MDFRGFLETLSEMKTAGWKAKIVDLPCEEHSDNHCHLRLRIVKPNGKALHKPMTAVTLFVHGQKGKIHDYEDRRISSHCIIMAGEFLDWYEYGHTRYAETRLEMLEVFGISREDIKKLAPEPRDFRVSAPCD